MTYRQRARMILAAGILPGILLCGGATAQADRRIPILIDSAVHGLGPDWPLYCGLPLGKGQLDADELGRVRVVNADGKTVPTQVRALALWNGTHDVRWLGVDFLGDPTQKHFLDLNAPVAANPAPQQALLIEDAGGYRIRTGPALFIVPRTGPILAGAFLDANGDETFAPDEEVLHNENGDDLYVIDNQGRRAIIGLDREDGQTRAEPGVEDMARQGDSVHACIRREGWYVTDTGERIARHITRLHFYRGKSFVRIEHSLILTENTNERWFREVGLAFRHRIPAPYPVVFDSAHTFDDETFQTQCPAAGSVHMFQEKAFYMSRMDPVRDCRFVIGQKGAVRPLKEGNRCGEWVDVNGKGIGLTLVLRNLWQQYPKELEAGSGALTAKLWSNRGGRELDLRLETLREIWPKEWFNADYWGGSNAGYGVYYNRLIDPKKKVNGLGVQKTHELLLNLHAAGTAPADIRRSGEVFARPVVCLADPRQLWKSEAMEPLYPRDPERFPKEEAFMEEYFRQYSEMITAWGDYGFLDYGNRPHVWYKMARKGPLKGRWMPYVARYSSCIDYGFSAHLWRAYARSGLRHYLDLAEETTRERIDINTVHWTESAAAGKPVGRGWYHRKLKGAFAISDSPIGWGLSYLHTNTGTDLARFYWFYYLRDYRPALAAAEDYRAFVKRVRKDTGSVYGSRPFAVLNCLATLYQETGDPEILAIGREGLQQLVDLDSPRGTTDKLATGRGKWGTKIGAVVNWYHATGDELAAKSVLRAASMHAYTSTGKTPFSYFNAAPSYLNLAWRLSGDPVYLQTIRRDLDLTTSFYFDSAAGNWRNFSQTSASNNRYPMRGMAIALDAVARCSTPIEPIPQVQQSGFGPRSAAIFRKDAGREIVLYLRCAFGGELDPAVFDLAGKPIDDVVCEPLTRYLDEPEKPHSFRVTVPASVPAGDYLVDPGANTKNAEKPADRNRFGTAPGLDTGSDTWEITWSSAEKIVLFAPNGLVTGPGRVWESTRRHVPGAPVLGRVIEWRFAVPQGVRTFEVVSAKPFELSMPDGTAVIKASDTRFAEKKSRFHVDVPVNAPEQLWRLRAETATLIAISGVPPIFAADLAKRYFVPETAKIPLVRFGLDRMAH